MLSEHFPDQDDFAPMAYRFNRIMANRFYEVLDFINLHYCLTRRTDTEFWREVQRPERINDRLKAKLEFWRVKPPSAADFEDQFFPGQGQALLQGVDETGDNRAPIDTAGVFTLSSYEAILYGMDFLRDECDQWFGSNRPASRAQPNIARRVHMASQMLPTHEAWLKHVTGMENFPVR
jgi:tryptophan halogenase